MLNKSEKVSKSKQEKLEPAGKKVTEKIKIVGKVQDRMLTRGEEKEEESVRGGERWIGRG